MLQFLNEDLVFEESASPPRFRTVNQKRTVYNQEVNSLDSPVLQHNSGSESDKGLWTSAVEAIQRIKRSWWDGLLESSEEKTDTTSLSTTLNKEVSVTNPETTSEPQTSNT